MSPLSLRRHRAERLLREEFEGLRERVLVSVRERLRASGVRLDRDDLEACYATAWQGLYAAVLDGQEIANPTGWLVLVTFRRAIEEQRARVRARCGRELSLAAPAGLSPGSIGEPHGHAELELETVAAFETDFAAELDDRTRLRQLFEGLRGRLDGREREAATLCYLQGLSRSEAAARMGVSDARMRKLMEGRGPGRPGVAGKVGALVAIIREGEWCDEQGSLMRALAYGILDPDGERYQLALMHHGQCPACRAYVTSLRGLAVALPPVLLPWGVGAAALTQAGQGLHWGLAAGGAGGGASAGGTSGGAVARAGSGAGGGGVAGAGAVSASGAVGAGGVAGGGWLMGAGPLGAKLAVGCLLALGVGAGCVALGTAPPGHEHPHERHRPPAGHVSAHVASAGSVVALAPGAERSVKSAGAGAAAALAPSARASREFGPQALASGESATAQAGATRTSLARSASSGASSSSRAEGSSGGGSEGAGGETSSDAAPGAQPSAGDSVAAEREFSPG
jgi:DNA-directed RNA polymerase specialized sigma24 family protein